MGHLSNTSLVGMVRHVTAQMFPDDQDPETSGHEILVAIAADLNFDLTVEYISPFATNGSTQEEAKS
jgi:hypothetical protein